MATSTRALRALLAAIAALFLVLVVSSPASAVTTISPQNAPPGTHLQTGTISCTPSSTGVNCTQFELAGVGNTNATVRLAVTYSSTIECTNKGGNVVESHEHDVTAVSTATATSTKHGRLLVPAQTSTAPTDAQILQSADCPNPNWTPSVQPGSVEVESFTYTLTFAGFTAPYITITG